MLHKNSLTIIISSMVFAIACKVYTTHTTCITVGLLRIARVLPWHNRCYSFWTKRKLTMAIWGSHHSNYHILYASLYLHIIYNYTCTYIYANVIITEGHMYMYLVPYIHLSCCSGLSILLVWSKNTIYMHVFKTIKTNDLIVIWLTLLMYS